MDYLLGFSSLRTALVGKSVVLLLLTLVTGLTGNFPLRRKLEIVLLGISGTFLLNLLRINAVVLVAYCFGQLPATVVHDYDETFFTIIWFFFFWYFSYRFILEAE